jgi:nucleoside-diphosphate-sugar epimerase
MSVPLKSALVTGSTGFIGSVLVDRLLAENVEVTCLVRSKSTLRAHPLAADPRVRFIEVPSFETSVLQSALAGGSAEAVFHLASYGVQQTDRDIDQLVEGNISILLHLLRATAHWPLRRFVHTGSCSEYGDPGSEGTLIAETQPVRPGSLYGAVKAASVLSGTALAAGMNIPFVTLRLFGVFGTRERPPRLIPYLISRLQNDEPVDLTPGEQVRDFLFEDDVAAAFLDAATSDSLKSGQVYNVCSSRPTRIREVGEMVADAMGKPRELLHWGERSYRSDELMWVVGDNCRFREATAWAPTVPLSEGIARVLVHACTSAEGK